MPKTASKYLHILGSLLIGALLGFFAYKASLFVAGLDKQDPPAAVPSSTSDNQYATAAIGPAMLDDLTWPNVDKAVRAIGTDSAKISQVIQLTADVQNPVALYLRGFVMMISEKPLQALTVFDQLSLKDIPEQFLYPPYRLHRQMRPKLANRYLEALIRAIDAGSVPPLITARVESQEGDLYSALSNYLRTDPGQWVTFDVQCIQKIGHHAGLSSEVRRMIFGALKSGRVSEKVDKPLRRLLALNKDKAEVAALKRTLQQELLMNSSTGKIAVSSVKQMLDTRKLFMQKDYQKILNQHQDTNPLTLPNEAVLILFLSGVKLADRLEMDRWGQEIKRRYPNREVVGWVSKLTTSVD